MIIRLDHSADEARISVDVDEFLPSEELIEHLVQTRVLEREEKGYTFILPNGSEVGRFQSLVDAGITSGQTVRVEPRPRLQVFISYARENAAAARRLYDDLLRSNLDPWIDSECLVPGAPWRQAIRAAIRESKYFVVLLSSTATTKRGYIQKEVREALEVLEEIPQTDIFLIPARLEECRPAHDRLCDLQWVDLFPSWESGVEKILTAIKSSSGRRDISVPTAAGVREKLLEDGWKQLQELARREKWIEIADVYGNPPHKYALRMHVPGIVEVDSDGIPKLANVHDLTVTLDSRYPFTRGPEVRVTTPIFHPNIYSEHGLVCLGWHAIPITLPDLCRRVAAMIMLHREYFNLSSPCERRATDWVRRMESSLPLKCDEKFDPMSKFNRDLGERRFEARANKKKFKIR